MQEAPSELMTCLTPNLQILSEELKAAGARGFALTLTSKPRLTIQVEVLADLAEADEKSASIVGKTEEAVDKFEETLSSMAIGSGWIIVTTEDHETKEELESFLESWRTNDPDKPQLLTQQIFSS